MPSGCNCRATPSGSAPPPLVQEVTAAHPYPSSRQRDCVNVLIHDDFIFFASPAQFQHVLDNLIKNARHSLTAADSPWLAGALRIKVDQVKIPGPIAVANDGMGIAPALLQQLFKPFFSSNRFTGHGLDPAFAGKWCKAQAVVR